MTESRFRILDWSAFAPGLENREAWRDWARAPHVPTGEGSPALAEMAPLQRRRVERLGRMALQVAYWCQPAADPACPLVFASRHGDLKRTYAMLQELARDQSLSPTQFGLSTHNAIAAQYGIARNLPANYLAVSAGAFSSEAAVLEAQALLADGAPEVLVVNYDALMPEDYAPFRDEPDAEYAWAWRIGRAGAGEADAFSLGVAEPGAGAPSALPHGLEVLRFVLSGDRELVAVAEGRGWRWRRHA